MPESNWCLSKIPSNIITMNRIHAYWFANQVYTAGKSFGVIRVLR